MNDQKRRTNPSDPTAERTAEQSTQTASGLSGGRGPEVASERQADEVLNRSAEERYDTPRRYEHEEEDRDDDDRSDPVLPSDDATLNTKI